MKIEYGNKNRWAISSIVTGEAFEYDGIIYLKTDASDNGWRTCVSLVDGHLAEFDETLAVYKCDVKMVVK